MPKRAYRPTDSAEDPNYDELVTISSNSSFEADIAKMYLELQGISVFLPDQYVGAVAPHIAADGEASAVRIKVPRSQVTEAKRLLAEKENHQGHNN